MNKVAVLSHGKIADMLGTRFGLDLTRGASAQIVLRVAERLETAYEEILQGIMSSVCQTYQKQAAPNDISQTLRAFSHRFLPTPVFLGTRSSRSLFLIGHFLQVAAGNNVLPAIGEEECIHFPNVWRGIVGWLSDGSEEL